MTEDAKIEYMSRILEKTADAGAPLNAAQINVLIEVFGMTLQQLDLVAAEMLAWRTLKEREGWTSGQGTV